MQPAPAEVKALESFEPKIIAQDQRHELPQGVSWTGDGYTALARLATSALGQRRGVYMLEAGGVILEIWAANQTKRARLDPGASVQAAVERIMAEIMPGCRHPKRRELSRQESEAAGMYGGRGRCVHSWICEACGETWITDTSD